MKILPLVGLSIIEFGELKAKAIELFGVPDSIENINGEDGVSSEIFNYLELGLNLYFDSDRGFILEDISVYSALVELSGFYPVGSTEQELLSRYPKLELEISDGRFKDYVDSPHELLFFLRDNIVQRVDVSPNIDNYIDKYECSGN